MYLFLFYDYLKIHTCDRLSRDIECFPVVTKIWQPRKIFLRESTRAFGYSYLFTVADLMCSSKDFLITKYL